MSESRSKANRSRAFDFDTLAPPFNIRVLFAHVSPIDADSLAHEQNDDLHSKQNDSNDQEEISMRI